MIDFVKEFLDVGKYKEVGLNNIDKSELLKGIKVEIEHTTSFIIATKIALDHLAENPKYYSLLEKLGL